MMSKIPTANLQEYRRRSTHVPSKDTDAAYVTRDRLRRLVAAYVDCIGDVHSKFSRTSMPGVTPAIEFAANQNAELKGLFRPSRDLKHEDFTDPTQFSALFGVAPELLGTRFERLLNRLTMFAQTFETMGEGPITSHHMTSMLDSMGLMATSDEMRTGQEFVSGYHYE